MKPATPEAYDLLHHGCIALSNVEANGMRIDVEYLNKTSKNLKREIEDLEHDLKSSDVFKMWKREFGTRTNLGSREQFGKILFDVLGHECKERTANGKPKMDSATIASIDEPFAKTFVEIEQLKKIKNTFLAGIQRQVCGEFIHPVFNLHTVQTYRSSSDSPNFQNFPVRDPKAGELIRRCFIPREGHRIVEVDFTGLEVRIAACYHNDPVMLEYIHDTTKDMHRDMAAECFKCEPEQVSKQMRYCGKNMFIFPQFYGDYYLNNAKALWESIDTFNHEIDGVPAKEHLKRNGIQRLGACDPSEKPRPRTFERHLQSVEHDFWTKRFKVYGQWKKDWFNDYLKNGGFNTLTGFKIEGVLGRNDVINYPVQGSAFHCLLWSLIQLNRWMTKRKMRSKIVGQIHDSIVADVHEEELEEFLKTAQQIMTKRIRKRFDWINVPLDVEAEVTPINGSWYEKKEIPIN
jgi:DNA polymerase-1